MDINSEEEQQALEKEKQKNIEFQRFKFRRVDLYDKEGDPDPDEIISIFEQDKDKFIGEFMSKDYKIIRGYVHGQGKHLRLYYTKVEPFQAPRAQICIVHGFGEHSGRFLHMADFFAKKNLIVHMVDLRGFGYSGGPRGASTVEELHQDIETLLKQAVPELPLFLYGHSLGGLLVLSLVLRNPDINLAGVISTSALIGFPSDRQMTAFKKLILQLIGQKLDDLVVNSMVHPTSLTKNNLYIKKCFGDRLMIPFLGLNMARSISTAMDYILPNAFKFTKPLIIIHGQKDSVTNHKDSIAFYNKCQSLDKTLRLFEEGYHELQHDIECDQLKQCLIIWIQERIDKSKAFGVFSKLKCGVIKKKKRSLLKTLFYILILLYLYYFYKLRDHPQFATSLNNWLLAPFIYFVKKFHH